MNDHIGKNFDTVNYYRYSLAKMFILAKYLYNIVRSLRDLCYRLVHEFTQAQSYVIKCVGHSDVCLLVVYSAVTFEVTDELKQALDNDAIMP